MEVKSNNNFEFRKQQYISLREEIKETKGRIFKLVGLGPSILPIVKIIGDYSKSNLIYFFLPAFIVIVALLYLSESHALMRCGRYIREHIEPEFMEEGKKGWEMWLEDPGKKGLDTRSTDKYLSYAFYGISILSYIFSLYLIRESITSWCEENKLYFTNDLVWGVNTVYVVVGIFVIIFFKNKTRHSTSTS